MSSGSTAEPNPIMYTIHGLDYTATIRADGRVEVTMKDDGNPVFKPGIIWAAEWFVAHPEPNQDPLGYAASAVAAHYGGDVEYHGPRRTTPAGLEY